MLTEHGLFPAESLRAKMGRVGRHMRAEEDGLRTQDEGGNEWQGRWRDHSGPGGRRGLWSRFVEAGRFALHKPWRPIIVMHHGKMLHSACIQWWHIDRVSFQFPHGPGMCQPLCSATYYSDICGDAGVNKPSSWPSYKKMVCPIMQQHTILDNNRYTPGWLGGFL